MLSDGNAGGPAEIRALYALLNEEEKAQIGDLVNRNTNI